VTTSQIAGRLLAVLDPRLDRRAVGTRSALVGGALLLLFLLPLAGATPVATSDARKGAATEPATVTIGMSAAAPASPDADAPPLDLAEASRGIAARGRALAQLLARGDITAAEQFYTEDVQIAAPFLPIAHGRQGARSLLQHLADAGVTRIELDERELYPVGALACETGRERLTAGAGAPVGSHRVIRLWKNENGSWRIHREWATR
jgi:ketosteroid isomerase-like protein